MPKKFLPPQTTTAERLGATPIAGELFYDINLQKFFYGDGVTLGGLEVVSGTVELHTHDNKAELDKIGEDVNGQLTYDGASLQFDWDYIGW